MSAYNPSMNEIDVVLDAISEYCNEHSYYGGDLEKIKILNIVEEKLKAWKRLKDKGFRFDGWEDLQAKMGIDGLMLFSRDVIDTDNVIGFKMDDYHDCIKDLNTCFGGKE